MLTTITVSLNSVSFSWSTIFFSWIWIQWVLVGQRFFFHEFVFKGRGRKKAQRGRRSKVNLLVGRKEEVNCNAINLQWCNYGIECCVVPSCSNCFLKPRSPTLLLFFNNRKKAEEEERLRKEEEAEAAAQIAELDRQLKVIRTLPVGYRTRGVHVGRVHQQRHRQRRKMWINWLTKKKSHMARAPRILVHFYGTEKCVTHDLFLSLHEETFANWLTYKYRATFFHSCEA